MTILEKAIEAARDQATKNYRYHKRLLSDWRILQTSQQYWPDTEALLLEIPGSNWFLGANIYGGINIYIELPWNKEMADKVLLAFIDVGWELSRERDNKETWGEYNFYLIHEELDGFQVSVEMDANVKSVASKCKVEAITYIEEVEKTRYEIVCDEEEENADGTE